MQKLNKQFYSYYDGAMHKNIVWTGVVEGDHDTLTHLVVSVSNFYMMFKLCYLMQV